MKHARHWLVLGLLGGLFGCATNLTVKMPPTQPPPAGGLLAEVQVTDLRAPGVAASTRQAAFGTPMGNIRFDPPEAGLVKQTLESGLTRLLREHGATAKQYYTCEITEFGVNTRTTPLYWDVVARIHLVLRHGERRYELQGSDTQRTYVWPGESVIRAAVQGALDQIVGQLPPAAGPAGR